MSDRPSSRSRRAAGLAALAGTAVAALAALDAPATAQTDEPGPGPGSVELVLLDQQIDLQPGGTVDLTFAIVGDLASVAQLTPPTTTTTTTTTTSPPTTAPPTTAVDAGPPAAGEAAPAPTTTATTAPPTSAPPTTEPVSTEPPPPPIELSVAVTNYEPLTSTASLDRVIGADPPTVLLPGIIDGVLIADVRPLIEVAEDGSATMRLSVPTDVDPSEPDRLEFEDSGIHPIVVDLRVADQVVASYGTIVNRLGDERPLPTIDLSLLTFIADPGPSGTTVDDTAAVRSFDRMVDAADQLGAPFAMSIPPAIATQATAPPGRREATVAALVDDELLSVPATAVDVSSAAAIGRIDSFVRQLNLGEADLADAIPATPIRRDVWVSTTPISAPAAQFLRDLGVRYLAMPESLYTTTISPDPPRTDQFAEVRLPDGGTMPILVLDGLGASLTRAATNEILDGSTSTEWAMRTIAAQRIEQSGLAPVAQTRERSRLLATPDLSAPDPRLLRELERLAAKTDIVRFTPASELTGVTDTQRLDEEAVLPDVAGPSLEARLELITATEQSLASVASMLSDSDPRPAEWTRRLDSFVSTAFGDDEVAAAIDELIAEGDRIRDGVVPPEPFTFTLTGRDGEIELGIGNELDEPIDVLLRFTSSRLAFPEGDRIVTLAPDQVTEVVIPVSARANGTTAVNVEILTPVEEPLVEPVTLTARVTALTGLGPVLTGGLVLILLTWWFSHWRARRRERALAAGATLDDYDQPAPSAAPAATVGGDLPEEGPADGDTGEAGSAGNEPDDSEPRDSAGDSERPADARPTARSIEPLTVGDGDESAPG